MTQRERHHKALVVFETQINAQIEALAETYAFLKGSFDLQGVSSIYLKYSDPSRGPSSSGILVVAVILETKLSAKELLNEMSRFEATRPQQIKISLVAYDDQTVLTAPLALPHPELHVRPHWLIPCAEIWGEYPHPILGRPLQELAGAEEWGHWGQFYSQGLMLEEFSSKRRK